MALYNKGRDCAVVDHEHKWQFSLKQIPVKSKLFNSKHLGNYIWPVSHASPYAAGLTSVLVRTLWSPSWSSGRAGSSVSPVTRIKMTERRPFTLTPDRRHPVCVHTHFYTFTQFKQHALLFTSWFTRKSTHTQANKNTIHLKSFLFFVSFFFFFLPYKAFRIKTAR